MFDGRAYWRFIHYFSIHNSGRELLKELGRFIDCQKCKESYIGPTDEEDLRQWSFNFHNKINEKLNKPILNVEDIVIDASCDICNNVEPQLLWIFTHNVAEAGDTDAINFLKAFNDQYPCATCRGNLLPDIPADGEKCLYWTFRHRKRKNDIKGLAPFIYEMNPPKVNNSVACQGCPT
jgi:hypothetical protein